MATSTINFQPFTWEYDVFLSFRGEDTRKNFTDHLYSALRQAGIHTFRDEEELRKGEYLAPELTRAIQSSRISIIVFSKDYASSRWCLDELVQIVECKEKENQKVFPIFYDVEPSEVREQSGNYGMAFAKHEELFGKSDKVQKWRDTLTKVANMSGWDLLGIANGYESKFIHAIIKKVQLIVQHVPIFVAEHRVGLDSRVEHVVQLLCREPNDGVRIIGIYGMGGIGKTILARAVYNRLFGYFESSCFLEIESAISGQQDNGIDLGKVNNEIKVLQKELLEKFCNEVIKVNNIGEGIMLLQKRLRVKKCLIVFDNLEHIIQFNALCGDRCCFGGGSRLILTTREKHVLKKLKDEELYEANVLNYGESLQLFSLHAFREPTLPKEDYDKILNSIVAHCGGLPLALEVLGTYLSDKSRKEWISAFEKLKEIPNNDVQAKLKISYDGLPDGRIKSAFLDLVCFSGEINERTFDSTGNFSNTEIRELADRCLIKKVQNSWILHDLIREMGREIIRLESFNNPGERSRLWCPKDIHDVLVRKKGTKKIEMIVFDESPMKNMKYSTKAFKDMKNLRFLRINGEYVHLDGKFKHLCEELRCLIWDYCPLKYITIPSNSCFEKLVMLKMERSNIKKFQAPLKFFPCLEYLNLGGSKYLTKTPNFSGAQKLRTLSFSGCKNLVNVHSSIGELVSLKELDFGYCSKLRKLPNNLCQLLKLESINVSDCKKLKVLPKLSHSVNRWLLDGCLNLNTIQEFPPILTRIYLAWCINLEMLPQLPPNLESIDLSCCKKLKMLPQLPPNLESIKLWGCKKLKMLSQLPPNLKSIALIRCENLEMLPQLPPNLESINLSECKKLKMLPQLPPNLESIDLSECKKLKMLPQLPPNLESINLSGCKKLKMLPQLPPNLESIGLSECKKLKMLPQLPPNLESIHLNCINLEMLPQLPPNLESINLWECKKLKMLPQLPPNLKSINLIRCENLEMLPQLPPNLKSINLNGCRKLTMIPTLPQKLEFLEARNCVSLEEVPNLSNYTKLRKLDLRGCRKLKKEISVSEMSSIASLCLRGCPHIIVPDSSIKELLLGSKVEHEFECSLTCNEIPSWIECKEEGSLLYFQCPLYHSENYTKGFLGFFFWVVFKAQLDCCEVYVQIYIEGRFPWYSLPGKIQLDVEEISYLLWHPFEDGEENRSLYAGEVKKVDVEAGEFMDGRMVKKIGVVALYRDTNGFVHLYPSQKLD